MVKISKMSGKLKGLEGINTNPLTNEFCSKMSKTESICSFCYSRKMVSTYRKSAAAAWSHNGRELSEGIVEIPKIKADMIRFHAHGELINKQHYDNYVKIAAAYPGKTFALWTKRKDLISDKPENMILVYSNPCIDKPMSAPPKGFDKVFNVLTKDNGNIQCAGKKCIDCKLCYKSSLSVINELLRK
jgi:hypothetical protein